MEFLVLGPFRVEDGGNGLDLGGPKQRTVLALLLASVGRLVPTDTLLMETYGPDVDPRVRRSVQTWISGFRRQLGPVIESRSGGYLLDVDRNSIDAYRFEQQVADSRRLRNDAMARDLLAEALALWRGHPYADAEPAESLVAEAQRLEALWAEALDRRIRLDLDAGLHGQLVPELETLVAEHPHHEHLRAHHMVALYRCGRQADALRSYRAAEEQLRQELGVDPSPELRALELRILEQDHALDFRPMARLRPIPARYTSFLGRVAEVGQVRDLVRLHRLVTITGPGGIGKSSLGAEVVRSLSQDFAVAFVPIESQRDAGPWHSLAESLGIQTNDDLPERVTELIGDKSVLLLLDGCEHDLDEVAEVVTEVLTRCPNARVLVTSREALGETGEHIFTLGPVDGGDGSTANELFLERAGLDERLMGDEERSMITTIGTRLGGLPLGLELAAARAHTMPLAEIAARLDDQLALLQAKRSVVQHHQSIAATIDWSYDLLDSDAQQVFVLLGAFPTGAIAADAVRVVVGSESPVDALEPLIDASLVARSRDSSGVYEILEPIRQYAEAKLIESGQYEEARLRYAEWIVQLCESIHDNYLAGDFAACTRTLRTHWPSVAATAAWATDTGHSDITLAIIAGAGRRWPNVADPSLLLEPGIAALAGRSSAPVDLRVRALGHLAYLHTIGQNDEALRLLGEAEREADRAGDLGLVARQTVASMLSMIPVRAAQDNSWQSAREWEESLGWLDRSIELAVEMGHPGEPHLYNRALILEMLGDLDGARRALEQLRDWAGGERPVLRALALHVIARWQTLDGDGRAGLASATEAARLFVDAGDLDYAAEAEYMLASINAELGRFPAAEESIGRGDGYHRQIGLPPVAIEDPNLVARVAAGLGQWDRFVESTRRFLEMVPPPEDRDARSRFLEGDPGNTSLVARMIPPTVRFLEAHGEAEAAARLAAAMPAVVRLSTDPGVHRTVGIVDRTARLADELDLPTPSGAPNSPAEAFAAIADAVRAGQRPRPSEV